MLNKKNSKLKRRLKTLCKKFKRQFKIQPKIDVVFVDDYYVANETYAMCTPSKDGRYKIHVSSRQPVELILDCFAHELGHVAIMEDEEIVCDYIATKLGRYR